MRPQQNRRMRGRSGGGNNNNNNNNSQNRRGPNPLTRNYESNGPDVKIRGSAQQIAEKYTTLARDAQSSGDRVMAENYLQHAEHYNRIIMAAQAQMPQPPVRESRDDDEIDGEADESLAPAQQAEQPRSQARHQEQGEHRREERRSDERRTEERRTEERSGEEHNNGTGPQPVIEGFPAELTEENQSPAPAPVKARTPRRRVAAKVEAEQPEAQAAASEAAPEAAAPSGEASAAPEEVQPRTRRPRRPRLKAADEVQGAEDTPASDEEVVTEAAQ